jgi:V8-like Glu-specific endopeptidase
MKIMKMLGTAVFALGFAAAASGEEGMWTFDAFPVDKMRASYGWAPDQAWLDRVRAASVRLTSGCSASLVSKQGLILTAWHCSLDCAQNNSTVKNDYVKNGFSAAKREDEKTCPGLQAEILTAISDVTDRVQGAITKAPAEGITKARNAEIAAIESESCKDTAKNRCEVVQLYHGGQFKLYTYRKYTDVRLVFIPEHAIGFFGGDPDNFNFPRYNLDVSFVRLYEDGKPLATPMYLGWRKDAPKQGELLLISGNPASGSRLKTIAELEFDRDWYYPTRQLIRSELRGRLYSYSALSEENRRQSSEWMYDIENSYKATLGRWNALIDPAFMAQKAHQEADLHAELAKNASLAAEIGDPWADAQKAIDAYENIFLSHDMLEARAGSISDLFLFARRLVRAADERTKPNGDRMPDFTESSLPLVEKELLEDKPIHSGVERIGLELWLSKTRELLTVDDPTVQHLLGKESPADLAKRLVAGTKLANPKVRKALWLGGKAVIDASSDPLIRFVRATDPDARAVRLEYESKVEGPLVKAAERIAHARFVLYGASTYPDGTFTLRLTYGTVDGWTYHGRTVAPFTMLGGLFDRATGATPFVLPKRWLDAKPKLALDTPFNISTSNDVLGGNSGSPVVDREGRVIGEVFDGNIYSLGGDYGYDGRLNRAITVVTPAIEEALRKIYGMSRIMDEVVAENSAQRASWTAKTSEKAIFAQSPKR